MGRVWAKYLTAILAAAVLGACPAFAGWPEGDARIEYGAEWGYTATCVFNYQFDYTDSTDGFRVDESGTDLLLRNNAYGCLYAAMDFHRHYAVSVNAGFAGIYQERRFIPVGLRGTYFFKTYDDDGVFALGEYGRGFYTDDTDYIAESYKLGCGYRYALGGTGSLDFIVSARIATDRPDVYNFNLGGKVEPMYLRKNKAWYGSINFSLAFSF